MIARRVADQNFGVDEDEAYHFCVGYAQYVMGQRKGPAGNPDWSILVHRKLRRETYWIMVSKNWVVRRQEQWEDFSLPPTS